MRILEKKTNLMLGQEAINEHIGEDNELDVGVEYKVHDPAIK